jgi:hypothetical protein
MTLFQQVLWMTVNIRVLGKEPASPLYGRSLIQYAATLQLQYSRICTQVGSSRRREGLIVANGIIQLLGLIEAAEPLPVTYWFCSITCTPVPLYRRKPCGIEIVEDWSTSLDTAPQPLPKQRRSSDTGISKTQQTIPPPPVRERPSCQI